jgi:hypothetical protein
MYVVVQTERFQGGAITAYGPWDTWQEAACFAEDQRAEGFNDSHVVELRPKDSKPYC